METAQPTTDFTASPIIRISRAIASRDRMALKRDGSRVRFDLQKITRAIALAFHEVRTENAPNPYRDDELALYGLDSATFQQVAQIAESVSMMLELFYRDGRHPTIEQVQDSAERAIAAAGEFEVARAYILYRARHAERRLSRYTDGSLSMADYIAQSKYARYRPELGRRETFGEGVDRVRDMHLTYFADKASVRFPSELPADVAELAGDNAGLLVETLGGKPLDEVIRETFAAVARKEVLPSMRSMQFGGRAILVNHSRLFNCSFSNVDRVEFFREYFFLLLSGCGVGFSVQKHHVALLPHLPQRAAEDDLEVQHHTVADTVEGWCDALDALFKSHYEGKKIEFNYSLIRHRGAPLKTSGGKAPGHRPLKVALEKVDAILAEAAGRALRPIEVYDINMFVAKAVLSGGVRRSATIALFSPDDEEMMNAKTGSWFEKNPQRSASNNSAVLSRNEDNRAHFEKLFQAQKEFGEPGFYFSDHLDAGCNPCVEIGLSPVADWPLSDDEVANLLRYGYQGDLPGMTRLSGFQMCVHGDTPLLTRQGITSIKEAVGKRTEIWNGKEWSAVTPFVTGHGRKLYRVHLSDGSHLDCTSEHNWAVRLYGSKEFKLSTRQMAEHLSKGRRLSIPRANVRHPGSGTSVANAYEYGFVLGDGTTEEHGVPFATCFKNNQALALDGRHGGARVSGKAKTACRNVYFYKLDRPLAGAIKAPGIPLPSEVFSWDEKSVLDFIAGWIDADGSQANAGCRLYGESAKLKTAQLLLTKCGINASLNLAAEAGQEVEIEGRKVTRQTDLHYLQIPNASRIPSRRLSLAGGKEPTMKGKYQTVRRIEELPGEHTTYCFTEPKRHMGLFGNVLTYQCNLSTINAAAAKTALDFYRAVIRAVVIGTLQAAYTVMPYLGPITRLINEHDALLGVSICGFMDNPDLFFDPAVLTKGARLARAANRLVAHQIGIRHASRVTCVKPEGTASLLLSAASGIHPHHARRYFRRVTANRAEPVYQFFKARNPQMTEVSVYNPGRDDFICFPVEASDKALLRGDVSAEKFLQLVRLVQQTWVINGTDESNRNPEIRHNVSNTCTVKADEWDIVREFIWANRRYFTGISLLVEDGDKKYPQAPREEVTASEADIARWNSLQPNPVDYTEMREATDETKLADVAACAGGSCELK